MDDGRQRVALLSEDEELVMTQVRQDLELFGKRVMPVDPEESCEVLAQIEIQADQGENMDLLNTSRVTFPKEPSERPQLSVSHYSRDPLLANTDKTATTLNIAPLALQTPMEQWLDETQSCSLELNNMEGSENPVSAQTNGESMEIELFKRVHVNHSEDDTKIANSLLVDDTYVTEKFDLEQIIYLRNILDRFPSIPMYLALRLAQANAERAKRLAQAHENCSQTGFKIKAETKSQRSQLVTADTFLSDTGQVKALSRGQKAALPLKQGHLVQDSTSYSKYSFWTGRSKRSRSLGSQSNSSATNDSMQTPDLDVGRRSNSVATGSCVGSGGPDFVLPPPLVDLKKESTFVCDICGKQIIILRRRDWQFVHLILSFRYQKLIWDRFHVLQDLQPYICFFEDCPTPLEGHTSRRRLLSHVHKTHRRECKYKCTFCNFSCRTRRKASIHLESQCTPAHEGSSTQPEIVKEFGTMECFICGSNLAGVGTKAFTTHLSRHLERIAFLVLAKQYGEWKFYEDVKSNPSSNGAILMDPEVRDSIVQGRIASVKQLLHDGILRDGIASGGCSALHLAAVHGQSSIVWLLLHSGFDVSLEATDPCCLRWTALHYASAAGHGSVIRLLLRAGALQPSYEPTPLWLAVENGRYAVVEILLAADHGWNFKSPDPPSSLMLAVRKNCTETVHSFLVASEPCSGRPVASEDFLGRPRRNYAFFIELVTCATEWNAKSSIEVIFQWASRPAISATLAPPMIGTWSDLIAKWISIACQKGNIGLALLHISAPFLEQPPPLSVSAWMAITRTKDAGILLEKALLGSTQSITNGLEASVQWGDLDLFSQVVEKAGILPATGWTRAASCGNLIILLALLNRAHTPASGVLEAAAESGHSEVIRTLLLQFPLQFPTQETDLALFAAVRKGSLSCVQALVSSRPPEPGVVAQLLQEAARDGHAQIVDFFLNGRVGESLSTETLTAALVAAVCNRNEGRGQQLNYGDRGGDARNREGYRRI